MTEKPTAKKSSLTRNEYLMLVGLLTLAKSHHDKLLQLERATVEHLGGRWQQRVRPRLTRHGDDVRDRVSDAIYGDDDFDPDRLLELLDIAVEDA